MNKFNIGDKVQAEIHPKYKNKQFDGVGTITTVVKKKYKFLDNGEPTQQWYWIEYKEKSGFTNGMIAENEIGAFNES
jgi:hypothetical protein